MTPQPGDVWAVRTSGIWARLIQLGTAIRYLFTGGNTYGDLANHVVIVCHETDGVWWGIEGRPGGVGWTDLTRYIAEPTTVTNVDQPKTASQRAAIIDLVPQVLGKQYDWGAIMRAAARDLHLPVMFSPPWGESVPGEVICSSLADWLYGRVGLASPTQGRNTQPSDWVEFCVDRAWAGA